VWIPAAKPAIFSTLLFRGPKQTVTPRANIICNLLGREGQDKDPRVRIVKAERFV